MTVTLSPPMFLQFFNPNNSGSPASGYQLFTYVAGTTAKQATWTDSTQTTENSNPIDLDSNGCASVWLDPTLDYKFVLAAPNDTDPPASPLRTQDNIQGSVNLSIVAGYITAQNIGKALYPMTAAESAASIVPTNYNYPSGYADRYGTNTTPGTTPMDAAINAACSVMAESNSGITQVTLLASTYLCNGQIVVPPGVKVKGAGMDATTLVYGSLASGTALVAVGSSDAVLQEFSGIADFGIQIPASLGNPATGVLFRAAAYCSWSNIWILSLVPGTGLPLITGLIVRGGSSSTSSFGNTFDGGYIESVHIGVQFSNVGQYGTSQMFKGLNLLGANGDATSIGYDFSSTDDGFQTCIVGGFVEGFNRGSNFSTSKGVYQFGVYYNGNTYDLYWSGTDQYCQISCTDLGGFTQGGTYSGPTNGVINGGAVNGVYMSTGNPVSGGSPTQLQGDITSVALDGAGTALQSKTAGNLSAVAIGKGALAALTTATNCTGVGVNAGGATTTAGNLTAVGTGALSTATGVNNTALGASAGNNITTGTNCTALGFGAQASAASATNEITLGNSSIATLRCEVTSITALSDARDKESVEALPWGLRFIRSLRPVRFKWKRRDGSRIGEHDQGFIAQELQRAQLSHEATELRLVYEANPERLEATPARLIPVLVKAIQELATRLEALERK